jgi:hypothetical protein
METKQESSQWKTPSSPRPKKKHAKFAATSSHWWSFFLTLVELWIKSLFHLVTLSMGIFNAKFWYDWGKMCVANGLWKNGDWLLHHGNAPPTSRVVRKFLIKNSMTTVPHPACSPDLPPYDFCVFPKMKLRLKGRRFVAIEEIQAESQQVLNTLRRQTSTSASKNGKITGIV